MQRAHRQGAEQTGLTGCRTEGSAGSRLGKVDSRWGDLLVNSPGQAKKSRLDVLVRTLPSGALVLPGVSAASSSISLPVWAPDQPNPEQAVCRAEKLLPNLPLALLVIWGDICMRLCIWMEIQTATLPMCVSVFA